MKENKTETQTERKNDRKKRHSAKDKKSLFSAALACAAVILAVVLAVTFATSGSDVSVDTPALDNLPSGGLFPDDGTGDNSGVDVPVEEETGMILPLESVSVTGDFGFHYNQTLDCYFHHEGVDFTADVGAEVLAVDGGRVESVFVGDVLSGGEIVIDHGNGLKTTYRYVQPIEGLMAGDEVKKGDVIAVVAEATGTEYKDGAHLHFEISEGGQAVDPAAHLSLAEK